VLCAGGKQGLERVRMIVVRAKNQRRIAERPDVSPT
jgi:hypothetical protein